MKRYHVSAEFPQALAKHTFQSVTVAAGSLPVAAARGIRELLKREGIKGRRHRVVKLVIQHDHVLNAEA